ncbi:MAG: hypothetical protein DIZ80_09895 [endosymbiont of Galathealinum brachiosum]|uniref:PilY1 beta-propeller domain-containing protein n=1 Tax=endosymbiont of Galathealinum brachiosum TaxID=2200906 RepID=A0A370DE56_9GAMM|nr:MAG: hypothetical protein DIZ80_09895 [endosymbiont of Galathealinum brachiosum]
MKNLIKQVRIVSNAMMLTIFVAIPAVAEDIEIYQNSNLGANSIQPNILFVLDTSGSMDDEIETQILYDPETDYSALSGCSAFNVDDIYYLPDGDSLTNVDCSNTYTANDFDISQNRCDALNYSLFGLRNADGTFLLDAFGNIQGAGGFLQSRFTQWEGSPKNIWDNLDKNNQASENIIECLADDGEHGVDAVSAAKWIDTINSGVQYSTNSLTAAWAGEMSDNTIFYSGNYAHYLAFVSDASNNVDVKKIDIMRNTIISIMDGGVSNVDVGLMKFNAPNTDGNGWNRGGTVMHPIVDIKLPRNDLFATMKSWDANGGTPLSESMYEAVRYFQGNTPYYGGPGGGPYSASGDAIEGSTTLTDGGTSYYKSPVSFESAECERQFIILLSDGAPTVDNEADDEIVALPDFESTDGVADACVGSGSGRCLDDLTKHLTEKGVDVRLNDNPGSVNAASLTGSTAEDVKISTYTVGFDTSSGFDQTLLRSAGEEGAGPGGYRTANNASDLLQVFIDIVEEIKEIDTTFASPAVSVNAFNRTTNRNDLYFTLFKPSNRPHWDGNFKRFKLQFDATGVPEIVDQNNNAAIDATTGFFDENAQSFWTADADAPDGSNTELGGAASRLFAGGTLSDSRKIYSNLVSGSALTASVNRVEENNANLTDAIMGVTGTDKTNLIMWARGIDINDDDSDGSTTDARREMGDPLHSQPALVEYFDGDTTDPAVAAFVATNDGYLHAFDTRTATSSNARELFAFIPKELLPGLNTIYTNTSSSKQYGLDGNVTAYVNDVDKDGVIETGDRVIIYVGMRRGGQNYYALDVTNPTTPVYLWTIYGGQDNTVNGGLGDYSELAQSWSTPQVKTIRLNGADVPVLIFGAGFDVDQDNATTRVADDEGRGIFIVNAISGELLWRMGPDAAADLQDANMIYSIPSDVAAADAKGDGYVDHLYVGDMGGQMWRVDINNTLGETETNIDNIITAGRVADLADDDAISHRRFFYPPDIALLKDINDNSYLSVLITSGSRVHPINKDVQDRAFMLRDLPVFGAPSTYETKLVNSTTQDLFDTTDNAIGEGTNAERAAALAGMQSKDGWYINFDASVGEKGLTKPLIFQGEAFFATFVPTDPLLITDSCGPREGSGFLYHINLGNGTPVENYDTIVDNDIDNLTSEDRKKTLVRAGIPAAPTLVIPADGAAVCVGTECDKAEGVGSHVRVYWYEEE